MPVQLNHTIVHAKDPVASAHLLATLLGLPEPRAFGHFTVVDADNGASLDFAAAGERAVTVQHYAFLVSESEFDAIWGRIQAQRLDYYADPARSRKGEINRRDGGRGVYWEDPNGHIFEILTRPYGSGDNAR